MSSSKKICSVLLVTGTDVSSRTVSRCLLNDFDFKSCKPAWKLRLTPAMGKPGSKITTTGVKAAGHLSKSRIQNQYSSDEQTGKRTAKLLEEQPQKKKWMITENKEVMMCYFEADLSQHGYRK